MKPIVLYFSRTGNTKQLAEAIADMTQAPMHDMVLSEPSIVENYYTAIVGSPVEGARSAEEAEAFVGLLLNAEGKRAISSAPADSGSDAH